MESTQRTRKKPLVPKPVTDARVLNALKKSSEEARRIAEAHGLPFIAGRRKKGGEGW